MGGARAIAAREDSEDDVDFQLVTTYTPVLLALLRSAVLVLLCEASVRALGPRQNFFAVLVVLVYCDAYLWRNNVLDRAVGFLCPVGLALLAATDVTLCSGSDETEHSLLALLPYWSVQVAWPLGSAYYLAASLFGLYKPSERQVVGVSGVCLAVHCVLLLAGRQSTGEVLVRAAAYYMTSMLFFHAKARLSNVDRNAHSRLTVHVCLHLLFVDLYVFAASVLVFNLLFWRMFYRSSPGAPSAQSASHTSAHSAAHANHVNAAPGAFSALKAKAVPDDVLQQLRAAQAARQA